MFGRLVESKNQPDMRKAVQPAHAVNVVVRWQQGDRGQCMRRQPWLARDAEFFPIGAVQDADRLQGVSGVHGVIVTGAGSQGKRRLPFCRARRTAGATLLPPPRTELPLSVANKTQRSDPD